MLNLFKSISAVMWDFFATRSLCPSPMKTHQRMWIQWPFSQKNWTEGHWPLDDLWRPNVEVTCVSLPKDHCWQVPWEYINVCRYSDQFCELPTKGQWPLDDLWPHICWSLMCDSTQGSLCSSPLKIHQSIWIQWPFCKKLEPKVIDP